MKIVIWTKSPPKIAAIESAIWKHLVSKNKNIEFVYIKAESSVSDMPLSLEENMLWAKRRVAFCRKEIGNADFYVWMEWWSQIINNTAYLFWAIYIENNSWEWHYWFSPMMEIPPLVKTWLYKDWKDLGPLMDELSGLVDIKKKWWSLELWSDWLLNRKEEFEKACICAISPFFNEYYSL